MLHQFQFQTQSPIALLFGWACAFTVLVFVFDSKYSYVGTGTVHFSFHRFLKPMKATITVSQPGRKIQAKCQMSPTGELELNSAEVFTLIGKLSFANANRIWHDIAGIALWQFRFLERN